MTESIRGWEMHPDPHVQFERWYQEMLDGGTSKNRFQSLLHRGAEAMLRAAVHAVLPALNRIHKNTMVLSTADTSGRPSARMVLLKSFDSRGLVFFTNYQSQKGSDLESNPQAELLFYWEYPQRQVRIHGSIERISATESDAYWNSRSRDSQISQAISKQSQKNQFYSDMVKRAQMLGETFKGKPVPRPVHWGGLRLKPSRFEFWEAGIARLHKRYCYERQANEWLTSWLEP